MSKKPKINLTPVETFDSTIFDFEEAYNHVLDEIDYVNGRMDTIEHRLKKRQYTLINLFKLGIAIECLVLIAIFIIKLFVSII